jgi:hypothetical protein
LYEKKKSNLKEIKNNQISENTKVSSESISTKHKQILKDKKPKKIINCHKSSHQINPVQHILSSKNKQSTFSINNNPSYICNPCLLYPSSFSAHSSSSTTSPVLSLEDIKNLQLNYLFEDDVTDILFSINS